MEYIQRDEYVEITPLNIRLRKIHLDENTRKRLGKQSGLKSFPAMSMSRLENPVTLPPGRERLELLLASYESVILEYWWDSWPITNPTNRFREALDVSVALLVGTKKPGQPSTGEGKFGTARGVVGPVKDRTGESCHARYSRAEIARPAVNLLTVPAYDLSRGLAQRVAN